MTNSLMDPIGRLMGLRYKSHPWHGVDIGENAPETVTAYVEIVPTDTVKYEVDKASGYLKLDRPQKYSNTVPALYGFIPQTFCSDRVGQISADKTGREGMKGDGDPLDICILTEKEITHGDILIVARPIGGFRMIDDNTADDKIIAVLESDLVYGSYRKLEDVNQLVIERLRHYFLTYKDMPGQEKTKAEITHIYNAEEAHEVIRASMLDYKHKFDNLRQMLSDV
ncbi:MAG TPA: inorganic pyrophosphatase [Bacteroidales bacterium]|nr:MAG: inorganic pyrophosphatase [Bacteroidetes bacterium GWF2_33_38]OFY72568.1 MAG: inorganic pyrophosphatase [Bacteroidetes bacterium RIFOXYA12_FULL_33_9]OFY91462.1 MAG: inorganic pyrophosphatase [Bacteroidetes bacterium RIFOXYA2_FULL_33_7]HBF88871.1 inorganic pyrophosphatase [Bacteroidales bacterium]